MTVANPVLNEPRHPWYQRRNHKRIPRMAESRLYLDASWVGGGAWTEVPFPVALADTPGTVYDPYHPLNAAFVGGAPTLGQAVGSVQGYHPTNPDIQLVQTTETLCPLLVDRGGRRGFQFDGVDDRLIATDSTVGNFEPASLPKTVTMFAMLYLDEALAAQEMCPLAVNRGEANSSWLRLLTLANNTGHTGGHAHAQFGGLQFVNNLSWAAVAAVPIGSWFSVIAEIAIASVATGGVGGSTGTYRAWVDGAATPAVDAAIVPDRSATAGITSQSRATMGCGLNSLAMQAPYKGIIGRSGKFNRGYSEAERAQLHNWMQGVTYIAPA